MEDNQDKAGKSAGAPVEKIDHKRRAALAKLSQLGVTGAAASVAILTASRTSAASAGSPL